MTLQEARGLDPEHTKWDFYFEALQLLRTELTSHVEEHHLNYRILAEEDGTICSSLILGPYSVNITRKSFTPAQVTVLRLHQLLLTKIEQELGPKKAFKLQFV
jgi:hypothetical protein